MEERIGERQVAEVIFLEKGRVCIRFAHGVEAALYRSELRSLTEVECRLLTSEGAYIQEALYQKIICGIVGLRAKKRAIFLLERMDRTEHQLCDKLKRAGYPQECIEQAIHYVKSYHYVDDLRYARQYIRLGKQKKSRQRLRMDLMQKGVARDTIEQALEEEYCADERRKIKELLEKRHYDCDCKDRREQQRMYQFLMRRGYKGSDILAVMRCGFDYE